MIAYASREGVFVHDIDSGKRVTALSKHDGQALAFHPSGEWLLSAGAAVWIARVAGTVPWRELYAGGRTKPALDLSEAVQRQMTKLDLEKLEQRWRESVEAAVLKLAGTFKKTPANQTLVANMRAQMEKQIALMRANFANLKAGKLPPPHQGNETVMCAGFSSDGKRLWLGTDRGIRVYDWAAVISRPSTARCPSRCYRTIPVPPR